MLKTWSELNLYRWCVLGYFRPTAKRPALLTPPRHPPPSPTPDRSFPAPLPRLKACEWNANKRLAVPFHSSLARLSDGSGIFVVMLTGGAGRGDRRQSSALPLRPAGAPCLSSSSSKVITTIRRWLSGNYGNDGDSQVVNNVREATTEGFY